MHNVATATQTVATGYNGWSNRETWVINHWLNGDECYYQELCDIVKNFDTAAEQVDELKEYVQFIVDTDQRIGITGDLLTTSLGRVNWYEIVESNQE